MKSRTPFRVMAALAFAIAFKACIAVAQDQQPPTATKATLGVGAVKTTESVMQAAQHAGTLTSLDRIVQAMDGQLIDRLQNTRKFTIVSRSDLNDLLREQNQPVPGNIDKDDAAAAQAFQHAGCKYLVITTVDNFQDYVEKAEFHEMGESASRRIVQFSAVAKIYDTTSTKLLESANLQLSNTEVERNAGGIAAHGDLKEELYTLMARMMAQKVADRVIDVLYPAKVIALTNQTVTINRGDGTNIAPGQVWEAFSLGKELKDPDTGAVLGHEEVKVGAVRIIDVQPLFSKGEVIEDRGVAQGAVLRLVPPPMPMAMPPGPPPGMPPGR